MTALDIFTYADQPVRTVTVNNEPWFVVMDVTAILGLSNPSMAIAPIDSDDLSTTEVIDSIGRSQTARTVNESGLYELIFQSRKSEARLFRRWVTHEVLPAIRKTGSYSVAPVLTKDEIVLQAFDILTARTTALEAKVEADAPLVAHAEIFRGAEGLATVGDVANRIKVHAALHFPGMKIRHNDVRDHAARLGLIIRGDTVRNNQPTAKAIEAGWVRPHESTFDTNTRGPQTTVSARLTPKGEARLFDGVLSYLGQHGSLKIERTLTAVMAS